MAVERSEHIHAQLKSQTSDVHESLHHHPKIGRLMANDLTEAEYYRLLLAYEGYYRHVEQHRRNINAWPTLSLEAVLTYLQQDLIRHPQQSMAVETADDAADDALNCLGELYVLHGATFGGKVIAQKLNKTLPNVPTTFFQQGVGMVQWQALLSMLSHHVQGEAQLAIVIASARRTFIAFGEWIKKAA